MTLLKLDNVSKDFGGVRAVDGISFEIDRGEVVGFLGPNGAGKSTTMRMITQYLDPDSGEIEVDGHTLPNGSIEAKQRIGYLPENNPLYEDMIVADYLEFMAQLRGIDSEKARTGIRDAVEATAIQKVYFRPIEELSKGFRQRVGLANAILHKPDLLILDEPSEGMDPGQQREIRHLISDWGKERAVIFSTHDLPKAQSTAHRIVIIDGGKIIADDTVANVLALGKGDDLESVFLELTAPENGTNGEDSQ
jgi:ABC-2 type transport system ATP-binding protein